MSIGDKIGFITNIINIIWSVIITIILATASSIILKVLQNMNALH
ncbi:hypothetical protein [Spiroplasma ixodetis]